MNIILQRSLENDVLVAVDRTVEVYILYLSLSLRSGMAVSTSNVLELDYRKELRRLDVWCLWLQLLGRQRTELTKITRKPQRADIRPSVVKLRKAEVCGSSTACRVPHNLSWCNVRAFVISKNAFVSQTDMGIA